MDGVADDVLERVLVLLLGLDHPRPEAPAEDMVLATVALVEGAGVTAVEVAHAVREVRDRRLDEQVVVVSHQAAHVQPPAVAPLDASQDVDEDRPVPGVPEDRRLVVPARADVVMRPGGEVAVWASHPADGSVRRDAAQRRGAFCHTSGAVPSRARHGTGVDGPWWVGTGLFGTGPVGAVPAVVVCWT